MNSYFLTKYIKRNEKECSKLIQLNELIMDCEVTKAFFQNVLDKYINCKVIVNYDKIDIEKMLKRKLKIEQ